MQRNNRDPLLIAIHNGDISTVMHILDGPITTEYLNSIRYGLKPLLCNVIHIMARPELYHLRPQYEDIISKLLSKGVNPCIPDEISRDTPFHLACGYGLFSVVLMLLQKGVDVLVKNGDGETPLHLAAGEGRVEIVSLISVYFPDISLRLYKDNDGNTPLHEAASEGRVDTVRLLLFKGADRSIANNDGRTAEDLAIILGKPMVVYIMNNGV
jgi:ankyrin repeat protein